MSQKILLIQSDESEAHSVMQALACATDGEFVVEWDRLCSDGLKRLGEQSVGDGRKEHSIKAVLVDLFLSDSTGIDTFHKIFAQAHHIPILILCGQNDEALARTAVGLGAQDYLPKARLDNYLLPKALIGIIKHFANTEALFAEKERAQVTLNSIGDAVMSTDIHGHVTYLNLVAESLTGWSMRDAVGHPVEEVFRIVDAGTRAWVPNPMHAAVRENKAVALTPNCLLIRRDGAEADIEDSAAPIHDRHGVVTGAVMVFHDSSIARATSARMTYLAHHDALTDLPNRLLLSDRLAEAIAMAGHHRRKLAVLYVDLDRFKYINDSLGHATGDCLLQSVAARLRTCVRESDTVSRAGGDEFVVLLAEIAHPEDAALTADKILFELRKGYAISQPELRITASIGISTYPTDATDGAELLKDADIALYHAKDNGRDQYQFFSSEMHDRVVERQTLEADLRNAIGRGELELYYQSKFDLGSGRMTGVEALVRWNHPKRGLMLPAQFLAMAEDTALIVPVGRWVLDQACRQTRAWHDAGLTSLTVAVNISAVELRAIDFVGAVRAILTETGLESRYLELELTETYLMQDTLGTVKVLHTLKAMGVQVALDDFGTGYSSLSYLKRFPIDSLKIDRSFVRYLTSDSQDASIVGAMVSLGRSLDMRVVAEGVETAEQLAFLRDQNCHEGQGFYFCAPMSAAGFAGLRENASVRDVLGQRGV